jgi:hypothetical protein
MSKEHDRLRGMVLVLEDLEEADRRAADEHLRSCDACRRLRERLLAAEAAGRGADPLSADVDPLGGLTDVERAQAGASLSALVKARTRRKVVSLTWIAPLAIAAALIAIALHPDLHRHLRPGELVLDLQVGSPLVLRSALDAPAATRHGVSFRLRHPGHPVLVHVDGEGVGRLIHPLPGAPAPLQAAGKLVLLPPPAREDAWRGDLAPGPETYLLSVSDQDSPPDPMELAALSSLTPGGDREEIIGRLYRALEAGGAQVVRLDAPAAN